MKLMKRLSGPFLILALLVMTSVVKETRLGEDFSNESEVWDLVKIYRPNYVEIEPGQAQHKLLMKNLAYSKMALLDDNNKKNSVKSGRIVAYNASDCDPDDSNPNPNIVDCPNYDDYRGDDQTVFNTNPDDRGSYLINKKNPDNTTPGPNKGALTSAAGYAQWEALRKSGFLTKAVVNGVEAYCERDSYINGDTSTCFSSSNGTSIADWAKGERDSGGDSDTDTQGVPTDSGIKRSIKSAAEKMRADINKCDSERQKVVTYCGSATQAPDQTQVRSLLEVSNRDLFLNLASQLSAIRNSNKDIKSQCEAARNVNVAVAAINGAYAKVCDVYRNSCETVCGKMVTQNEEYASNSLDDDESKGFTLEIASLQAKASNSRNECETAGANGLNSSINNVMQAATMAAQQAQQCSQMLSATSACQNPGDIARPECQAFCSQASNMRTPFCVSASRNCADPAVAATQPLCQCMINPQAPGCGGGRSIAGAPVGSGAPLPRGSGGGSSNADYSGSMGSSDNLGGVGFGGQNGNSAQGKSSNSSLARFQDSGGPGAKGASGGGQAVEGAKGGAGGAPYNANILNGFYEGGGGRKVAASAQGAVDPKGRYYSPQVLAKMTADQKRRLNLRSFLPKDGSYQLSSRISLSGSARLSEDGVTGPHGPTLFEKVSRRYRVKSAMLIQ